MATTNKDLAQPIVNSTNWDIPLNANASVIDAALGGNTIKNATGVGTTPVVLTVSEYQKLILTITGTLTADVTYHIPSGVGGQWIVRNSTTGNFSITIGSAGGGVSLAIEQGTVRTVYSDGTNIRPADSSSGSTSVPNDSIAYSSAGSLVGSVDLTYINSLLTSGTSDATTNTVIPTVNVERKTSGTAAAGIGAGINFSTETANGTVKIGGVVSSVLETATLGSETYKWQFDLMQGGLAATTVAEITSTGITFKNDAVIVSRAATDTAVQPLAYAGFTTSADNDGTLTSGTYTPTPVGGNMKRIVNGGAFTLAAPSAAGDYTMVVQITNNASAGAITLSGFSNTSGSAFTTVNGDDFFVYITKCNGFTLANVAALQ